MLPGLRESRTVWGVDPGLRGAVCAVSTGPGGVERIEWVDVPTRLVTLASGKRRGEVDCAELWTCLQSLRATMSPDEIVVEKVGAMPKQGVASTFSFGRSYGSILALLELMGVPIRHVSPATWKPLLGLSRDKRESVLWAREELARMGLPRLRAKVARMADEGRAEAFGLAVYGLRQR